MGQHYFEVQLTSNKNDGELRKKTPIVGIGLCAEFCNLKCNSDFVGLRKWSIGYHGEDGRAVENSLKVMTASNKTF